MQAGKHKANRSGHFISMLDHMVPVDESSNFKYYIEYRRLYETKTGDRNLFSGVDKITLLVYSCLGKVVQLYD